MKKVSDEESRAIVRMYRNIYAMMLARGINYAKYMSRELGVENSVFSRWSKGTFRPGLFDVIRVSKYLGVSVEELFEKDLVAVKPCPMCGSPKSSFYYQNGKVSVRCSDCGLVVPGDDIDSAKERWNCLSVKEVI